VRVAGSVEINWPADQVWAYVADYGNDTSWRAGGPPDAPVAARTGPGRRHHPRGTAAAGTDLPHRRQHRPGRGWTPAHPHAHDRQKQLLGSRLVEPTGPGSCRFTEVVEVRLLGLLRPWSRWWRGCSNGRPPPTSDASNTCWRRRRSSADQHRRRRRTELGPLVSADDPSTPATTQRRSHPRVPGADRFEGQRRTFVSTAGLERAFRCQGARHAGSGPKSPSAPKPGLDQVPPEGVFEHHRGPVD
jgi:hypothetical protein